jgi:hypothetical protein
MRTTFTPKEITKRAIRRILFIILGFRFLNEDTNLRIFFEKANYIGVFFLWIFEKNDKLFLWISLFCFPFGFFLFFTTFALWQLGQYSSILIFTQQKYNFLL